MQSFAEPHHARRPATAASADVVSGETPGQSDAQAMARVVGDPVAEPTPATRRAYAADWAAFVTWCRAQGRAPLPASPETLATYLLAAAPGLSRGAIGRRRAAIGTQHRQAGLPVPLLDTACHQALRQATAPPARRPAPQLTAAALVRLAQACPRDLPGLRDRALLLLAAATLQPVRRLNGQAGQPNDADPQAAVPRLFLLALDAEDVRFTASGLVLSVRTRVDQALPARRVTLGRNLTAAGCPVRALEEWLRASDTAFGPVFRKVDRWGNVEHGRLAPDAWHRILARRGKAVPRPRRALPASG